MTTIRVTAFTWVPPFAQGLVRDLRVRWALEEAGLAYEERLIGPEVLTTADYRAQQPFGQVPVYEEGELCLFESGAIVLHIAQGCETLLPRDAASRARALSWVFAAMNSIEPVIDNLCDIDLFHADQTWAQQRRPAAEAAVRKRLEQLANGLQGRDHLVDRFTAADLLMTTVLRNLRHLDLVEQFPMLEAYLQRCQSRPAFARALAAQMAPFARNAPVQ